MRNKKEKNRQIKMLDALLIVDSTIENHYTNATGLMVLLSITKEGLKHVDEYEYKHNLNIITAPQTRKLFNLIEEHTSEIIFSIN